MHDHFRAHWSEIAGNSTQHQQGQRMERGRSHDLPGTLSIHGRIVNFYSQLPLGRPPTGCNGSIQVNLASLVSAADYGEERSADGTTRVRLRLPAVREGEMCELRLPADLDLGSCPSVKDCGRHVNADQLHLGLAAYFAHCMIEFLCLLRLHCGHSFHESCLDRWFEERRPAEGSMQKPSLGSFVNLMGAPDMWHWRLEWPAGAEIQIRTSWLSDGANSKVTINVHLRRSQMELVYCRAVCRLKQRSVRVIWIGSSGSKPAHDMIRSRLLDGTPRSVAAGLSSAHLGLSAALEGTELLTTEEWDFGRFGDVLQAACKRVLSEGLVRPAASGFQSFDAGKGV
eukprot:Skav225290  [mRNA]  locus=scaffold4099:327836:344371:+ [translate_table: standard]